MSSALTNARALSPWRAILGFGLVSLAADMVYEGARSITRPTAGRPGPRPPEVAGAG